MTVAFLCWQDGNKTEGAEKAEICDIASLEAYGTPEDELAQHPKQRPQAAVGAPLLRYSRQAGANSTTQGNANMFLLVLVFGFLCNQVQNMWHALRSFVLSELSLMACYHFT